MCAIKETAGNNDERNDNANEKVNAAFDASMNSFESDFMTFQAND